MKENELDFTTMFVPEKNSDPVVVIINVLCYFFFGETAFAFRQKLYREEELSALLPV